jgi:hypothetical protein
VTPRQWANAATVAWDFRDRDAFQRALDHLVPELHCLTYEQLVARREQLRQDLADLDDRIAAAAGAGRLSASLVEAMRPPQASLEPSD